MIAPLSTQMSILMDLSLGLENACCWYNDPDPQYGGPPSKDQLLALAKHLKAVYMNMALLTGADPCEQLPSTKERLKRRRSTSKGDQ